MYSCCFILVLYYFNPNGIIRRPHGRGDWQQYRSLRNFSFCFCQRRLVASFLRSTSQYYQLHWSSTRIWTPSIQLMRVCPSSNLPFCLQIYKNLSSFQNVGLRVLGVPLLGRHVDGSYDVGDRRLWPFLLGLFHHSFHRRQFRCPYRCHLHLRIVQINFQTLQTSTSWL